jgi:hypothetical protein
VLVVAHGEDAGIGVVHQAQLPARELVAVRVAEERQQHAVGEVLAGRVPVDVEEVGESGGGAVLQQVLPPVVVRPSTPMWLGTMSIICARPRRFISATKAS